MKFNYNDLINTRIQRLNQYQLHNVAPFRLELETELTLNKYYQDRINNLKETGIEKTKRLIKKIQQLGYKIKSARISKSGVLTIVTSRNGYKAFGFISPHGKAILSNEKKQNILVVNYLRKNLVVHDKFLAVVVKG